MLEGGFSGAGHTVPPMVVTMSLSIARVPLALLALHWGWGVEGVWWMLAATATLRGVLIAGWFSLGTWKRVVV